MLRGVLCGCVYRRLARPMNPRRKQPTNAMDRELRAYEKLIPAALTIAAHGKNKLDPAKLPITVSVTFEADGSIRAGLS